MTDKQASLSSYDTHDVAEYVQTSGGDLQRVLNILRRNKRSIFVIIGLSLLIAVLNYIAEPPAYQAESIVMINAEGGENKLLDALIGPDREADPFTIKKDMELIKSPSTALQMVSELYKSPRRSSLECLGNRQYVSTLDRFSAAIAALFVERPLQATQKNEAVRPDNSEEKLRNDAQVLRSRINVDPVRDTNMLKISVDSPYPDEALYLTNTLCRVYREADIRRISDKYQQGKKVISAMLQEQEQKLEEANRLLSNYMAANKIYEFTGNTSQILAKITDIESKYNDIQVESRISRNNLQFLDQNLSSADKLLSASIVKNVNVQLGSILDEINGREREYIALLREKGDDDAEVKVKRQQLEVAKARYEQLNRSKIAGEIGYAGKKQQYSFDLITEKLQIERKLNQLDFSASEFNRLKQFYEDKIRQLPPKQQEYAKLQRDQEVVSKTYATLKQKLDETNIMLGSEVGRVSVAGDAQYPLVPSGPNLIRNLLAGIVLGLFLAFVYTGYVEVVDDTIKDDLFFKNAGIRVLSIIPYYTQKGNVFKKVNKKRPFGNLKSANGGEWPIITSDINSLFSESFRTLKTHIDYIGSDSNIKSILVSGTDVGEGKSLICSNLGISYSLSGQKTLIVDCDLRRSSLHQIFGIQKEPGLTDYLDGQESSFGQHYLQATQHENLYVLPAGKQVTNPHELIGSEKMRQLIQTLEGQFDKVLFDTTPLFFSEVVQLAKSIDGILLVARLSYTSKKEFNEFIESHLLSSSVFGVALIDSHKPSGSVHGKKRYHKYIKVG